MSPKLPTLVCKRCGHVWTPRVSKPVQCPLCRSRIWKKVKEEKENVPPKESMSVEVPTMLDGTPTMMVPEMDDEIAVEVEEENGEAS